jgi:cation:H+ antiporter
MTAHIDAPTSQEGRGRNLVLIAAAFLFTAPWIVLNAQGAHPAPLTMAALAGLAILGAAFMLSWAAEVFQMDVSQALALALLALIAVLPEYAVDAVFAYQAGQDPVVAQQGYAVANMTGANRLLIGLGWSSIVLLAWFRHGARKVALERSQAVEMAILLVATVYALSIPFKGELSLIDTAVLITLFGLYTWATSRAPAEEPHLMGPAKIVGSTGTGVRRLLTAFFFLFAAYVIFISAHPFAEGLVETGRTYNVDEFLLVQWLAPLASEAPEFIVALLFVWRGQAAAGMRTLVSSKVNQWTLLIATLPVVFSFGAGHLGGMPLVERQQHELWLTAAQSLFAIVLISEFAMNRWEAIGLLLPFVAQLLLPPTIGGFDVRMGFTAGYLVVAVLLLLDPERRGAIRTWPRAIRDSVSGTAAEKAATGEPTSATGASIVR